MHRTKSHVRILLATVAVLAAPVSAATRHPSLGNGGEARPFVHASRNKTLYDRCANWSAETQYLGFAARGQSAGDNDNDNMFALKGVSEKQ